MTIDAWRTLAVAVALLLGAATGNFWRALGQETNSFRRDHYVVWAAINAVILLLLIGVVVSFGLHPS